MKKYIFLCLLIGLTSFTLYAQKNKCKSYQKVIQQEAQIWNSQDLKSLNQVYAKNITWNYNDESLKGIKELTKHIEKIFAENDKLRLTIDETICGEGGLTYFFTLSGFNKPAGIPFSVNNTMFLGIQNGKIIRVKGHSYQLGAFFKAGYTLEPPKDKINTATKNN